MARNRLPLDRYEARRVRIPGPDGGEPREALQLTVFAPTFPQRGVEPELWVGEDRASGVCISRDQTRLTGYLHGPSPDGAAVRVIYGDSLEGVLEARFSPKHVRPLPRGCEG